MLGNVHTAHDLEARDDGALQFGGDRKHAAQKTVDTHTHDHFAVLRLQVDIARALGKRAFNKAVDKADRRRLDELLLRDKAGVVYQEKCAIAINFFLKIVNNVQYFSPFRTYLQPIFLFSSNLSCIFYRPLTALPFFCGNASPFPLFFQSFLAKQQEKPGKFPLNVPWFCAKFTLSIKCF